MGSFSKPIEMYRKGREGHEKGFDDKGDAAAGR